MTVGLSAIGPRLAELLPLLVTGQPGEVVATDVKGWGRRRRPDA